MAKIGAFVKAREDNRAAADGACLGQKNVVLPPSRGSMSLCAIVFSISDRRLGKVLVHQSQRYQSMDEIQRASVCAPEIVVLRRRQ